MYKDLFFKLISLPFTRDILNCILRYTMAQPVEMDFMVALFLVLEYAGLSTLFFDSSNESDSDEQSSEELIAA